MMSWKAVHCLVSGLLCRRWRQCCWQDKVKYANEIVMAVLLILKLKYVFLIGYVKKCRIHNLYRAISIPFTDRELLLKKNCVSGEGGGDEKGKYCLVGLKRQASQGVNGVVLIIKNREHGQKTGNFEHLFNHFLQGAKTNGY